MKRILLLLSVLMLCMVGASAAEDRFIYDDVHLLRDSAALETRAATLYRETGVAACFWSTEDVDGETPLRDFAAFVHEQYLPYPDLVFLVTSPSRGAFSIYYAGEATALEIDPVAKASLTAAYANAKSDQGGVEAFLDELYLRLTGQSMVGTRYRLVLDELGELSGAEHGALTAAEAASLSARAEELAAAYPFEAAVAFVIKLDGRSPEDYAERCYLENGWGYGANGDGLLLLVCPSEQTFTIHGHGTGARLFDAQRTAALQEAVTPFLSDGDWAGASMAFFEMTDSFLAEGAPTTLPPPLWIVLDIVGGLVLAGLVIGVLALLRRDDEDDEEEVEVPDERRFVDQNGVKLTTSRDILLYVRTKGNDKHKR